MTLLSQLKPNSMNERMKPLAVAGHIGRRKEHQDDPNHGNAEQYPHNKAALLVHGINLDAKA